MAIILDIIIIGIVALFAFLAAKKGFMKSLLEFASLILSIVLALTIGSAAANAIFDKVVAPAVTKTITETVSTTVDSTADSVSEAVLESMPKFIQNYADNKGFNHDSISDLLLSHGDASIETFAASAAENVVRPMVVPIISLILNIILFIVLFIALRLLSVLLNKILTFKFLGKINTTLGLIFGAAKGVMIALVFVFAVSSIVYFSENAFLGITTETINSTFIFKYISTLNPLI